MSDYSEEALRLHKQHRGKIHIELNDDFSGLDKLKLYYTPGVAAVSSAVSRHPETLRDYTWVGNTVAVISDGSAVLGLGNIGPAGAMPVMEGKCLLFKRFAGISAVPIVLDVHTADEIVAAVKAIAVSFAGINLEDIAAPICFEVEARLKAELPIPVFHDDQHGTAVVTLAGLINAAKITKLDLNRAIVTLSGVGAAGVAITKLLKRYAPGIRIRAVDSKGVVHTGRDDLSAGKRELLPLLDPASGGLAEAIKNANIFIGVSSPNIVTPAMIKTMGDSPIVFAMANPDPEIAPTAAHACGAAVVATGRSDYPNQVNNALAFPGIFRGALDHGVKQITAEHELKAAAAIAALVAKPAPDQIIPDLDNPELVKAVAAIIQ